MKKIRIATTSIIAGFTAVVLAACSVGSGYDSGKPKTSPAAGDAPVAKKVWRAAFNQPDHHPQYIALSNMSKRLTERTNGEFGIEIYPNEGLGAQKETIELVQQGAVDMAYVAGPLMENFNPDFVVFNLPFVFQSQDHQRKAANDPEIVSGLYSSLDDRGMHILGAFHGGVRSVYNHNKPINTPADLSGMKIRVIESDTNLEMMRLMGGIGTPMGQGEVYTAIQSGVIDGAENNETIYNNLKHDEIAQYYSYTRHLMFPDYLIINTTLLESLSEEHRAILIEEVGNAIEEEAGLWGLAVKEAKYKAEKAGAKFNEVDAEAFREAVSELNDQKLTTDVTKDIFAKVQKVAGS